jgi:GNAT superfamily N-acetyltransferase
MIEVAGTEHLALIASLIADGAREGSWDRALAEPGPASQNLMAKIGQALQHGALRQIDPRTGKWIVTRIEGWIYRNDPRAPPVGFGLFKEIQPGVFELWLTAIEPKLQGDGLGREMIRELMATPQGRHTWLARCAVRSQGGRRCAHVLERLGFFVGRRTSREEWLLHESTPSAIQQYVATADMGE